MVGDEEVEGKWRVLFRPQFENDNVAGYYLCEMFNALEVFEEGVRFEELLGYSSIDELLEDPNIREVIETAYEEVSLEYLLGMAFMCDWASGAEIVITGDVTKDDFYAFIFVDLDPGESIHISYSGMLGTLSLDYTLE